jgi:hypothetical protein
VKPKQLENVLQPLMFFNSQGNEEDGYSGIPKLISESDFADIQNLNQFESFLRSLIAYKKSVLTQMMMARNSSDVSPGKNRESKEARPLSASNNLRGTSGGKDVTINSSIN